MLVKLTVVGVGMRKSTLTVHTTAFVGGLNQFILADSHIMCKSSLLHIHKDTQLKSC